MAKLTIKNNITITNKYSAGDMFIDKQNLRILMLCQVEPNKYSLISLKEGNRCLDPVVLDGNEFTLETVSGLCCSEVQPISLAVLEIL